MHSRVYVARQQLLHKKILYFVCVCVCGQVGPILNENTSIYRVLKVQTNVRHEYFPQTTDYLVLVGFVLSLFSVSSPFIFLLCFSVLLSFPLLSLFQVTRIYFQRWKDTVSTAFAVLPVPQSLCCTFGPSRARFHCPLVGWFWLLRRLRVRGGTVGIGTSCAPKSQMPKLLIILCHRDTKGRLTQNVDEHVVRAQFSAKVFRCCAFCCLVRVSVQNLRIPKKLIVEEYISAISGESRR